MATDTPANLPARLNVSPLVRKYKDLETEIAGLTTQSAQDAYLAQLRYQVAALMSNVLSSDARQLLKSNPPKYLDENRSKWESAKSALIRDWKQLWPALDEKPVSGTARGGAVIDIESRKTP